MNLSVYIWKDSGGVDHLCDFQLNELTQNRIYLSQIESMFLYFDPESLYSEPPIWRTSRYNELNIWSIEFWLTNSL